MVFFLNFLFFYIYYSLPDIIFLYLNYLEVQVVASKKILLLPILGSVVLILLFFFLDVS